MKLLASLAIIVGFIGISATQAQASFDPNWEKPIYKADMNVDSAVGLIRLPQHIESTVRVVLTQRDGETQPTGLKVYLAGPSEKPVTFAIKADGIRDLGCGSKEYSATKTVAEGFVSDLFDDIVIVDHTHRVCDDVPANSWVASVAQREGRSVTGTVSLSGTAQPAMTIQDFEEYVH